MIALKNLLTRAPDRGPVDVVLAALAVALLGFGVVMVYSASVIEATVVFRDSQYFLKRQGFYALGALLLIFGISRIDYRKLRPFTYPIIGVVTVMMILSVIMGCPSPAAGSPPSALRQTRSDHRDRRSS